MTSLNKKLGNIIRQRRLASNLSQEKLAHLAGIHRTYISQIERGLKSPTINILNKIVKHLNASLSDISIELEKNNNLN